MSTRCEIFIKQNLGKGNLKVVKLYHHHDGYPEGVGLDLLRRSKKWGKKGWNIDEITNALIKDIKDEYEFTAFNHIDIDYAYFINCDNMTIKCFRATYDYNETAGETLLRTLEEKEIPQAEGGTYD